MMISHTNKSTSTCALQVHSHDVLSKRAQHFPTTKRTIATDRAAINCQKNDKSHVSIVPRSMFQIVEVATPMFKRDKAV
jgi:hypothetical protein